MYVIALSNETKLFFCLVRNALLYELLEHGSLQRYLNIFFNRIYENIFFMNLSKVDRWYRCIRWKEASCRKKHVRYTETIAGQSIIFLARGTDSSHHFLPIYTMVSSVLIYASMSIPSEWGI